MVLRCDECRKPLLDVMDPWNIWTGLISFIQVLETEESITPRTAQHMIDQLQWLKPKQDYREDYSQDDCEDDNTEESNDNQGNQDNEDE